MGLVTRVLIAGFVLAAAGPVWAAQPLVIDDFEKGAATANLLGGRSNVYEKAPSRALALRVDREVYEGRQALMLKYDKKGKGGPYGAGGWCGYYTLLKTGSRYFDASGYKAITFWVRGEKGGENFVIGLADRHWDQVGDSVKSEPIGRYLKAGKITTEWQKAQVPLSVFMVDYKALASVAFAFEGTLFPGGVGRGTVYIDHLVLE